MAGLIGSICILIIEMTLFIIRANKMEEYDETMLNKKKLKVN